MCFLKVGHKIGTSWGKQCDPVARTSVRCYPDGDWFNLLVFSPVEERMCCTKLLLEFMYYSFSLYFVYIKMKHSRSQWPRGLRRRSLAARPLRLWVRIPLGAWMFVCCKCCVLSGRGLCDGLIIRSEESYRMWRVVVCDQETS